MLDSLAETSPDNRSSLRWRSLAILWLCISIAIIGHNIWLWGFSQPQLDTDILSLLPQDQQDPIAAAALKHMAAAGEKRVLVLIGASQVQQARDAADAYAAQLSQLPLKLRYQVNEQELSQWREFFSGYRSHLLTDNQINASHTLNPSQWQQQALQNLLSPAPNLGLPWRDDPLGLFNQWLLAQSSGQKIQIKNGRLWLTTDSKEWAVLMLSLNDSPLSLNNQNIVLQGLQQARDKASQVTPDAQFIETGILQFAAAASRQAQSEMSIIGTGSLLGVILLVYFSFRRIRPLLLALTPILIGTLAAISVTLIVYGKIHAITLVFGASLVGVAEDYGIHYLCMGYDPQYRFNPFRRMRELLPALALAVLTTIFAYLALAFTPFPGLRQMALFAAVGLICAWLSAILWLPFLCRPLAPMRGFTLLIANSRPFWSQRLQGTSGLILALTIFVILVLGLSRLMIKDDLRLLQNAPTLVLNQQIEANRLLDLPSPSQFYIVRGASVEQLLEREAALTKQLQILRQQHHLSGYQAISSQVPSQQQQQRSELAQHQLYQNNLAALAEQLGADNQWVSNLQQTMPLLTIDAWLNSPVSEPWRHLWLGSIQAEFASIVSLQGVQGQESLTALAQIQLPGVSWVDKPAQISNLMAHYRNQMALAIAISFVLVYIALQVRYGRRAWRGLAPTLVATLLTLATLGLCGIPVQLFTVLALFLVLGMGIDYGIFMLEHPNTHDGPAWLAVSIGAASTLLSFGLLAFSQTPALHSFGLATLIGIAASWLLAPAFQPKDKHHARS